MKLPYRMRGWIRLMLLVLVLPAGAWRYALGETVRTAVECRRLRVQAAALPERADEGYRLPEAGAELILSGRLLALLQPMLTPRGVRVTGYTPARTERQGALALHTGRLELAGGFADLLRTMRDMEGALPGCSLRSALWSAATQGGGAPKGLTLTLYIQQIVTTR